MFTSLSENDSIIPRVIPRQQIFTPSLIITHYSGKISQFTEPRHGSTRIWFQPTPLRQRKSQGHRERNYRFAGAKRKAATVEMKSRVEFIFDER